MVNFIKNYILVGLALAGLWFFLYRSDTIGIDNSYKTVAKEVIKTLKKNKEIKIKSFFSTFMTNKTKTNKHESGSSPVFIELEKNKKEKEAFKEKALIDAEFPKDFDYVYFDSIAEETVLIEGKLASEDAYLGTIATKKIVTPGELLSILKSDPSLFPGLEDDLSWIDPSLPPKTLETPQGELENSNYWLVDRNGKTTFVIYSVRKDNKGSYLVIVDGPSDYIYSNEDKFDEYLASVKPK